MATKLTNPVTREGTRPVRPSTAWTTKLTGAAQRRHRDQPYVATVWRCAKCNTPVRIGRNDPCKCFPTLQRTA